jgi:hypothetical protein
MFQCISMTAIFAIASLVFTTNNVAAQSFLDLDKSPADIVSLPKRGADKVVKVIYSRPQAKGRKVFGELVDYDKVWRTGANEATEITFYKDVKIGKKISKSRNLCIFYNSNRRRKVDVDFKFRFESMERVSVQRECRRYSNNGKY